MAQKRPRGTCVLHPAYHRETMTFFALFDRLDRNEQETILMLAEIWAENAERARRQTRPLSEDEPVRVLGGKR